MASLKRRMLISIILSVICFQQAWSESQQQFLTKNEDVNDIVIENFIVTAKIKYRYARTRIFCQLRNTHQSQYRELPFILELPENAFISNFTIEMDGQRYKSFIKDAFEAERSYNHSREWDRTSAIVAQQDDFFNVLINVASNKTVLFYMEYEEEITKAALEYSYALHLVPKARDVRHFCVDVDVLDYQPITVTSVNLSSKDGKVVEVDLQKDAILLQSEKNRNAMRVIWEPSKNEAKVQELLETGIIGQFKLSYRLRNQGAVNDVIVRNGHFVHRLDLSSLPPLPVHVIFVLDVSGSMIGARGKQMKAGMKQILSDMKADDYFHLITFSSSAQVLDENFQSATPIFKRMTIDRVNEMQFNGDTNINEAILKGLEMANMSFHLFEKYSKETAPKCILFFLSDGHATTGVVDQLAILQNAQEMNVARVPIYTIGLGKEADHALLETLAAQNHGMHRKIYDDAKVELQVQDFYQMVASPILTDLNISYVINSSLVKVAGISYRSERSQWLSSGEELVVIGKFDLIENSKRFNNPHASFHAEIHGLSSRSSYTHVPLSGDPVTNYKVRYCPCGICLRPGDDYLLNFKEDGNLCMEGDEDKFMHRYWVYKTIKSMIREVIASGNGSVKAEVLRLSKQYHFVTPYTSLLITVPPSTKKNRFNYTPSPVPQLLPLKKDPASRKAVTNAATEFVHYSSQRNMQYQTSRQNLSLLDVMLQEHRLIHSQRNVTPDAVQSQASEVSVTAPRRSSALRIVLDLDDIVWLRNNTDKILRLRYRSPSMYPFRILEVPEEHMTLVSHPKCQSNQTFVQRCTHLVNCVSPSFINSFSKFVLSYFCPIAVPDGTLYTGTCCPI